MTTTNASPQATARIAGAFWGLTFVTGAVALSLGGGGATTALNKVASLCYVVATLFVYRLLKPVNRSVSLLAAAFGLAGCAVSLFGLGPIIHVRDLVFFGFHCLLVGYLILRSTFVPRFIGALMVLAGIGWLTFAWPPLAKSLAPYNMIPGMLGEGVLIVWLLVKGVDVARWTEQARAKEV